MPSLGDGQGSLASKRGKANSMLPGKVRGRTYTIHGDRLIEDVDLDLKVGRTVVMGANGAGKSVLLRLLHGLLVPTKGYVHWGGKPIDQSIRTRQAMVFQRPVLLRRSVQANVQFALNLRKGGETQRAREILEQVGLDGKAKRAARGLSGGEQQRLALARAMALEPLVLFLDEPTTNLDTAATAAIEMIVKRFHDQGTKIVLVTHDIGQAQRIADDVVYLHHGRLLEHTLAESFFGRPETVTARGYLSGNLVF